MLRTDKASFLTGLAILVFLITIGVTVATAQDCRENTNSRAMLFSYPSPNDPWDIAVSPDSTVYVTNPEENTICRYSLTGELLDCFGGSEYLDNPVYIALGNNGRVYVSDRHSQIAVFGNTGNFLFEIGADTLSIDPGNFSGQTNAIATDADGNLYVSEIQTVDDECSFDRRIQKFSPDGTFLSVFAQCVNFPPQATCGSWFHCDDLEVAPDGHVFLLDGGFDAQYHNRISRFSPSGSCEVIWGYNGDQPGELAYPARLATNNEGHLFVTDWFRIQEWTRDGDFITEMRMPQPWSFNGIDFFGDNPEFCYVANGIGSSQPSSINVLGPEPLALNILDSHWLDDGFELRCDDLDLLTNCQDKNIPMVGVSADGASPLLLRVDLPTAGSVQLSLSDPNHLETKGLGTLSNLCGSSFGETVSVQSELVDGRHIVMALYKGPEDFDRATVPSDLDSVMRDLQVEYRLYPDQEQITRWPGQQLQIHRPPLAFVHGLWDKPETWKGYINGPLRTNHRNIFVNYERAHGREFAYNWPRVRNQIATHISVMGHHSGIVTAQVDIIAHSMGGILTRKIYEADEYISKANFGEGLFNKVLFLNVPHHGSPMANVMVELRNLLSCGSPLEALGAWSLVAVLKSIKDIDNDAAFGLAIDDLSLGSPTLAAGPMLAPVHAHVGIGGSDMTAAAAAIISPAAAMHFVLSEHTSLPSLAEFDGLQHDAVVGRNSQEGGIYGVDPITLGRYDEGLHDWATKADVTGTLINTFIHTPVADDVFFAAGIPGYTPGPASPPVSSDTLAKSVPLYSGVRLNLYLSPGNVSPGGSVSCSMDLMYMDPSSIVQAYILHPDGMVLLDSEPFSGSFEVPLNAIGQYKVEGLAMLSDGTLARSESLSLNVDLGSAYVESIRVNPGSLELSGVGELLNLQVDGYFTDDIIRDLATSDYYMNYYSSDDNIVEVDDWGVVQAISPGQATLTVRLHESGQYSMQVLVPVTVLDGLQVNNPPHAVAGSNYEYCGNRELCLDGSSSSDYDTILGDNLNYSWDLNADGVFDDAVGLYPCVTPDEALTLDIVGLRVEDSSGLVAMDYAPLTPAFNGCHDAFYVCEAGGGDGQFDEFYRPKEVTDTPDGGFFVLNFPTFYPTNPEIHKFGANCEYEFTILPDFNVNHFTMDSSGILHIIRSITGGYELARFTQSGEQLSPIPLDVIEEATSHSLSIEIDANGYIYRTHGQWIPPNYNIKNEFLDIFNGAGALQESINLDQLLGPGEMTLFTITPSGDFYFLVEHQLIFVDENNGQYTVESMWGEEGQGPGQIGWVEDLAVMPDGSLLVMESQRVQHFSSTGDFLGQRTGSGDWRFLGLEAIASDPVGNVYVCNSTFDYVQVFNFSGGLSGIGDDPDSDLESEVETPGQPLILFASGAHVGGHPQNFRFAAGLPLTNVKLRIFDLRGRLVRELKIGNVDPGNHEVVWDSRNANGAKVASGVYLLRLEGGSYRASGKTVLIR